MEMLSLGEPALCTSANRVIGLLLDAIAAAHRGDTAQLAAHRQAPSGRFDHCLSLAGDRRVGLGERTGLNHSVGARTHQHSRRVGGGRHFWPDQTGPPHQPHRCAKTPSGPIPPSICTCQGLRAAGRSPGNGEPDGGPLDMIADRNSGAVRRRRRQQAVGLGGSRGRDETPGRVPTWRIIALGAGEACSDRSAAG